VREELDAMEQDWKTKFIRLYCDSMLEDEEKTR
jgi:hypothetical protein